MNNQELDQLADDALELVAGGNSRCTPPTEYCGTQGCHGLGLGLNLNLKLELGVGVGVNLLGIKH